MRLCDEKDSLHGRVFFCEKNAVRIASQINRNFNQIISWNKSPEMRRKRRVSGLLCVFWPRWMLRVNCYLSD